MLMKQQDRLEEREQDIEEQLYKLESDKRLVEVTSASPCHSQSQGLSPYGTVGTSAWDTGARWAGKEGRHAGEEQLDRLPACISVLSVIILEAKCVWSCSTAS